MCAIVSKFGGSSTANARRFEQILSIIRRSPQRRCVVLSAPGTDETHAQKVTAMLERCWQMRGQPAELEGAVDAVVHRYACIAQALSIHDVSQFCREEILNALYISRDHTLSRGEYLCAWLFSEFSGFAMLDARELVSFDERSGAVDIDGTLSRFSRVDLSRGPVVLPGFYGSDGTGRVVTFPRNGSDITGALAAAGVGARLYENWTDVPGLMTADPAIVPGARLIRQVGYRQMRQLARCGAQVLHPACLDPVAMAGIPTRLRCTQAPDSFGTLIDEHCNAAQPCLVGKLDAPLPEGCDSALPLARICVFGIREGVVAREAEKMSARFIEGRRDHTRVYFDHRMYESALRGLHQRLLG